jgi:UDP-glucose 4-epimerase
MKKKPKVLVTGAGGYIGSVATYLFLNKGYKVVALDDFSTGYREPLDFFEKEFGTETFRYYKTDLTDSLSFIIEKEKDIAAVMHYAASCSVDESMKNPQKYFSNNVCATSNLLTRMIDYEIKNIVFSSTCAVYGEAKYVPVDEKHPTYPTNPYGESKLMVEKMIEWYAKTLKLNYVILRYFNVCGASDDGKVGDSKKPSVHLMQNAVRGALGIEPFSLTCPKVDTKDGTPIRDYVNVVDLNEAFLLALDYLIKGKKSEIINLGTGTGNSVLEIVSKVEKKTGKKLKRNKAKTRSGEYATMTADIKKAKEILGWKPKRNLDDSIKSLITWYKEHPQGWN